MMNNPDMIMRDVARIGEAMTIMAEPQKTQASNILQKLNDAIDTHINHLEATMDSHSAKMDSIKKMTEACVAYTKQKGKGKD